MKVLISGMLLVAFLGASSADAWPWSNRGKRREKLPKPIDWPAVRPKADDSHKHGKNAARHPARFQRQEWGSEMGRFARGQAHSRTIPYLYQE
jgi:hypothetical protein